MSPTGWNMDCHKKAYVCTHVFHLERPVLLVTRPDGDWCLLCGDEHEDSPSAHRVGVKGRYEVLNVVRVLDAIDRERSGCMEWRPEDGRPDLVGQFRQVLPLVIRNEIHQEAVIFRPAGWEVVLITSARLKKELEKVSRLGVLFRSLEGGFAAN